MSKTEFTSQTGEFVNLETAQKWIDAHSATTVAKGQERVNSYFFGKEMIELLLKQENTVGIRIHFGTEFNEENYGTQKLIINAADSNGNDIYIKTEDGTDSALDGGLPCPPYCPIVKE